MMPLLITGVAGFIGFHLARACLAQGYRVIGIDSLTPYYDVRLKEARLAALSGPGFQLYRVSLADREAMESICRTHSDVRILLHMAAQAGVRYSLENPFTYVDSNLVGHVAVLEFCRHLPNLEHLVYASSSSVYGNHPILPSSPGDRTDCPISLYAATKKSAELLSYSYSHLYGFPATGLRFFTVYGPWGRPDMAPYLFTKALLEGAEIPVFNHGKMRRNFTYIDDVVAGVLASMVRPPSKNGAQNGDSVPHAVHNIGNHTSVPLMEFIDQLSSIIGPITGRAPRLTLLPMQPGDVQDTVADIQSAREAFGFDPKTDIAEGLEAFVAWYRHYIQA